MLQHAAVATAVSAWWKRENLLAGAVLLTVAALAWVYTLWPDSMQGMDMPAAAGSMGAIEAAGHSAIAGELLAFLFGWAVMMIAMMLPAVLPLVLLYRMTARQREPLSAEGWRIVALLAGYIVVWTVAGLPVYAYNQFAAAWGSAKAALPAALLIVGGVYQFTALKRSCHARCSNPLFFLMHQWRPGATGAARLGVLHGLDCLGCCAGLMVALVALGMMNLAWMLTATVIIFAEKTLPGSHRLARPLGVGLMVAGLVLLAASLRGSAILAA